MRGESIYANLYIKYSNRALRTPRVGRPWRPRMIAWAGPTAFMRDRFYEIDTWYKARIQKPEILPKLHVIDPDKHLQSLSERLAVPKNHSINIGFKPLATPIAKRTILDEEKFEKLARKNLLQIDLAKLSINDFALFDHFHIFQDLFMPGVYFHNTQNYNISFASENTSVNVGFGNSLSAVLAKSCPKICIEKVAQNSESNGYNTLLMVNMDGDAFTDYPLEDEGDNDTKRQQILHWFIGNIPDSRPSETVEDRFDTIVPYLAPLPFRGTGYHRVAFVLFRHSKKIEFGHYFKEFQATNNAEELLSRRFDTNMFAKHFEEQLTPSAFRFCQVRWDESCDETFKQLNMKSPRYWYKWSEPLKPKQKEFPIKPMPFQHYLDMYRPAEKVRREVQRKRLELLVAQEETANEEEERLQKPEYPDMFYQENVKKMSYWQHEELLRRNSGQGKYVALYSDYVNPAEQHVSLELSKTTRN